MSDNAEITLTELSDEQLLAVSGGTTSEAKSVPHCPYCGSPSVDLNGTHVRYEGMTFPIYQCTKCGRKTTLQQMEGTIPLSVDFSAIRTVEESMA